MRDIAPVAAIIRIPNVMVVHPSVPATSIPEFIAYARAHPGKINFASAGTGTSQHVAGELFKIMAGIDMVHIPYRGTGPALTDLLAGRVQVLFLGAVSSMKYVESGKLRALALTSAARSPALPNLPTMAEFLPGFEASLFYGMGAPRNTPAEIIERLNKEINAGLADPAMKARLAELDGMVLGGTPADFARLIADETDKWRKVIKAANIRAA
jgi:tripartite-type tricarboxylate transporter receptor subunit TctC